MRTSTEAVNRASLRVASNRLILSLNPEAQVKKWGFGEESDVPNKSAVGSGEELKLGATSLQPVFAAAGTQSCGSPDLCLVWTFSESPVCLPVCSSFSLPPWPHHHQPTPIPAQCCPGTFSSHHPASESMDLPSWGPLLLSECSWQFLYLIQRTSHKAFSSNPSSPSASNGGDTSNC